MISVVTALYNYANFVSDAIKSVQRQSYQDFEMIIVDDCSTDNPYKVLDKIKDSRIKIFKLDKNHGPSYSRNYAIKKSIGNFITFLDADDMLTENSLLLRLNCLLNSNALWCHGRSLNLINGKIEYKDQFHSLWKEYQKTKPAISTNYSKCIHSNSVLVKRQFYVQLGMFDTDLRYGEEQDLWKRAIAFGHYPVYVTDPVCIYRNHNNQTRFKKGAKELKKKCFKLSAERLEIRLKEGINSTNTILL
jgi:glycosyltransferase involved in cell wall biosynthesis